MVSRRAYGGRKILRTLFRPRFPWGKPDFPVTIILFLCVRFPDLARSTVGSLAAQAWVLPSLFLSRFPYGSPLPGGEDPPYLRGALSPVRQLRHTTAIPRHTRGAMPREGWVSSRGRLRPVEGVLRTSISLSVRMSGYLA